MSSTKNRHKIKPDIEPRTKKWTKEINKHVYSGPKDQHLFVKFQRGASTIVYKATPFFFLNTYQVPKNAFGILYNYSSPQATPTSFITQRIHGTGIFTYMNG